MANYTFHQVVKSGRWSHPLLAVFFAPPSYPLVYLLVNFTPMTANQASILAGMCGMAAAVVTATQSVFWGAVLFCCFFVLDCVDGPLARLRNTKSAFGAMLDLRIDRMVIASMMVALVIAYTESGEVLQARLAALFGAGFFYYDIFGMYRPDRELGAKPAVAAPPSPGSAGASRSQAARLWSRFRGVCPTQSLCSVTFFAAGGLFHQHAMVIYSAACFGLMLAFLSRGAVGKALAKLRRTVLTRRAAL